MKRWVALLCATTLVATAVLVPAGVDAKDDNESSGFRRAVELARDRVYPSLVNILVVGKNFRQGREVRGIGAGSGVIVSPAGHVLTNFHVAGDAARITCRLPSGERVDADIITPDSLTDLCVLKLRMDQRRDPTKPLPFASIGDSEKLRVGDHVLAMGNPRSLSSSITLGIVSNTTRVFTSFAGDRIETLELGEGQLTGIFNRWIQHDALIQPGNSGGPLVNMSGEVVGINTRGGAGVGFAIPATTCKKVLNQALTFGEVRRGWLGLTPMPVEMLDREDGALVSSVLPTGPAAQAGIRTGDIIVAINGEPVALRALEDVPLFLARMADLPAGKKASFQVVRGTEAHTLEVTVQKMERTVGEEKAYRIWGVSAMDITGPMALARDYPNTDGIRITSVSPGSAPDTAKPGLRRNDVVLSIDGVAVNDLETFASEMRKHKRSKALSVRFRRGKGDYVTVLDMSKKPKRRGSAELSKAWLGVRTQVLTPKVAKALGLEGKKGFRVTRVLPGTEAEKAGLKAGDVLTALDGDALDASDVQDAQILRRRVEDMDIGAETVAAVLRDGKAIKLTIVLEETPTTAADVKSAKDEILEYKVREMTYMDRVDRNLSQDFKGLVVSGVEGGGWANVAGLRGGDVLLELQDQPVHTVREFKKLVKKLHKDQPKRVRMFVRRGRSTTYVFMQPDWPQDD